MRVNFPLPLKIISEEVQDITAYVFACLLSRRLAGSCETFFSLYQDYRSISGSDQTKAVTPFEKLISISAKLDLLCS